LLNADASERTARPRTAEFRKADSQWDLLAIGHAAFAGKWVPHYDEFWASEAGGNAFPTACLLAGGNVSAFSFFAFFARAALLAFFLARFCL
jgi:hypothetical protein